jgi:hypothetical protein
MFRIRPPFPTRNPLLSSFVPISKGIHPRHFTLDLQIAPSLPELGYRSGINRLQQAFMLANNIVSTLA